MSIFDIFRQMRYHRLMTLNVSLTPQLEDFIRQTVVSGRYQSASEVVREGLRLLEEREWERLLRLDKLCLEIKRGLESGPSKPLTSEYWQELRERLCQNDKADPHG